MDGLDGDDEQHVAFVYSEPSASWPHRPRPACWTRHKSARDRDAIFSTAPFSTFSILPCSCAGVWRIKRREKYSLSVACTTVQHPKAAQVPQSARRGEKIAEPEFGHFGTILGQRVLREIIIDPPKSLVFRIECPKTHLLQRGRGKVISRIGVYRVSVQGVHFGPARRFGRFYLQPSVEMAWGASPVGSRPQPRPKSQALPTIGTRYAPIRAKRTPPSAAGTAAVSGHIYTLLALKRA